MPLLDLTGQRFNRLVAVEYVGSRKWRCRCDCGSETVVQSRHMRTGRSGSCGCLQRELMKGTLLPHRKTHGHSEGKLSPTYVTWQRMKQRCYYPKADSYQQYGGAGVTVCDRWRDSFEAFLQDMGERPRGMTIDRLDNAKGYEPGNCRWAPQVAQERNKRNNRTAFYEGKERSLAEIADMAKVNYRLLYERIVRHGWPLQDALSKPARAWRPSPAG